MRFSSIKRKRRDDNTIHRKMPMWSIRKKETMIRRRRNSFNLRFEPVNSALRTIGSRKIFTWCLMYSIANSHCHDWRKLEQLSASEVRINFYNILFSLHLIQYILYRAYIHFKIQVQSLKAVIRNKLNSNRNVRSNDDNLHHF